MQKIMLLILGCIILCGGCVMNKTDNSHKLIELKTDGGLKLTIDVEAGEKWSSRMKAGPFIFNVLPQMAVWTEDSSGRFIETLYITGADFKKMNHALKNEDEADFFKECLPYWAASVGASGGELPSKKAPYPDTLTSATPAADFTIKTSVSAGAAYIYAELNKADDKNTFYTEDNNSWAGQPSLIYAADLSGISESKPVELKLKGHGGMIGAAPEVYGDLSGFDSALLQIKSIKVSLR